MSKRGFISYIYIYSHIKVLFLRLRKTKKDLMECRGPKHGVFRGYYILACNLLQFGSCTNISEEMFTKPHSLSCQVEALHFGRILTMMYHILFHSLFGL